MRRRSRARRRAVACALACACAARWRGARATSCVADGSNNVVQIAPQATWECCADDVARVEYEANVPSGFYDPMRWVVRDDPSGLEHASTACDVTQAAGGLSMACAGAACDGSDPEKCEAEKSFSNATRRCLRGKCTMPIVGIGSNAMCNSNVKVTFGGVGASGRKEDDVDADLTMSIGLSMAFGAVAMFCRVFAIARASKVSMRHAMFVNPFQRQATIQRQLTMRQQQRGGACQENPPAPQAPREMQPTAPSQIHIPGRGGQRDTVVVFQQSAPAVQAPAAQSPYATPANQYYPDI